MLPDAVLPVPASLMTLLAWFAPLFTAPSFRTFCGLACGFLAQPGKRTVCGMLLGAGLSRCWPHDRAHYFFARAGWELDELGLAVARIVVMLLVPAGERGGQLGDQRHRGRDRAGRGRLPARLTGLSPARDVQAASTGRHTGREQNGKATTIPAVTKQFP